MAGSIASITGSPPLEELELLDELEDDELLEELEEDDDEEELELDEPVTPDEELELEELLPVPPPQADRTATELASKDVAMIL